MMSSTSGSPLPPPSEASLAQLDQVVKTSRRESIAEVLRKAIIVGDLKPGQRMVESHLARALGVSQVSIREALQVLENQGLVIKQPNRGTYVTKFTIEELLEATEIRIILESRAGVLAHKNMTDADAAKLRGLVQEMERCVREDQMYELVIRDLEFHSTLWRVANNLPLERALCSTVYPLFAFLSLMHPSELRQEPLLESVHLHDTILDAVLSGDRARIEESIRTAATFARVNRYLATPDGNP